MSKKCSLCIETGGLLSSMSGRKLILLASIPTFYTSLLIFPRCEVEAVGITEK